MTIEEMINALETKSLTNDEEVVLSCAIIRKQAEMLKVARDGLEKISYAKPDCLDHSIDVGIIDRASKIAKQALATIEEMDK